MELQPWIFKSKRKKARDLLICKVQEASFEVSDQVLQVQVLSASYTTSVSRFLKLFIIALTGLGSFSKSFTVLFFTQQQQSSSSYRKANTTRETTVKMNMIRITKQAVFQLSWKG